MHWDSRVSINGEERPEFFLMFTPFFLASWTTLVKSCTLPSVSGYWNRTPAMSLPEKSVSRTFWTSILMPKGRARVATQLESNYFCAIKFNYSVQFKNLFLMSINKYIVHIKNTTF